MKHRLADKILVWKRWAHLRGVKAISFEEYSLRQPLGYDAALPESLAMGAILEMGNWLTILSSEYTQITLPIDLGICQILHSPRPGERLSIEVQLISRTDEEAFFHGQATVDGQDAIRLESWTARLLPLHEHYDPTDLRVLYSQIGEQT